MEITFKKGRPKKYHTEEERKAAIKKYYSSGKGRVSMRRSVRNYNRKVRLFVIQHYGNYCTCCRETAIEFLGINHMNGNGINHRKEMKTATIYTWLKKNNFPTGYEVMCHNCNLSLGFYGYCPHQGIKEAVRKEYKRVLS